VTSENISGLPRALWHNRFARFLMVGGVNTLFGYLVFAFLIFLKLHYAAAVFLSTFIGILFNFKTTGKLVFGSSDNGLIVRFFGVYGMVYILNTAALKVLNMHNMNMYFAGAVMLLPMALISFLLLRGFVFRSHSGSYSGGEK